VELEGKSGLVVPVSVSEERKGGLVSNNEVQVLVEAELPTAVDLYVFSDGLLELD